MKIEHPQKPDICEWIHQETWNNLKLKEKDYIILLYCRRYTKKQIMRKLYFTNRDGFYSFTCRVRKKLKNDLNSYTME